MWRVFPLKLFEKCITQRGLGQRSIFFFLRLDSNSTVAGWQPPAGWSNSRSLFIKSRNIIRSRNLTKGPFGKRIKVRRDGFISQRVFLCFSLPADGLPSLWLGLEANAPGQSNCYTPHFLFLVLSRHLVWLRILSLHWLALASKSKARLSGPPGLLYQVSDWFPDWLECQSKARWCSNPDPSSSGLWCFLLSKLQGLEKKAWRSPSPLIPSKGPRRLRDWSWVEESAGIINSGLLPITAESLQLMRSGAHFFAPAAGIIAGTRTLRLAEGCIRPRRLPGIS